MAIFRKDTVPETEGVSTYPEPWNLGRGKMFYRHITEAGGLTRFGAAFETLLPGGQSSQPHWESDEDEFLYMLEGELTVVEDGVPQVIHPGDACCWKAGVPVSHTLKNLSDAPARYLIIGSRSPDNICHYPGLDLLATPAGFVHLDGTPYPKKGEQE